MARDDRISSELSRDLSLFQITMMGVGMMIGAGVFLGTGKSIGIAGPGGLILTFALNGLVAIFTAMSYAELSSAIPRAGGAYNFARVAFGQGPSFMVGWMEWFASSVAGSLYAVCFATYMVRFVTGLGLISLGPTMSSVTVRVVAAAIAIVFIYINYRGASEMGRIGAVITLGQTLLLLMIGAIGVAVAVYDPERLKNFHPFINHETGGWTSILVTMGFTAVAFEGYEVIAQAGDEAIDPRRNIPKAMIYSVFAVTVTYVIIAFATVVAVKAGPDLLIDGEIVAPWKWIGHYGGEGFGAAIEKLLPGWGAIIVTLAVVFASTSALNATVYSATRSSYALGREAMLPPIFARVSSKRKTPYVALLFTSLIVIFVATSLNSDQVAAGASIMFLMLFLVVNICAIRIRRNMGDELHYGFIMPLFPLLPVAAIVCQCILALSLYELGRTAWIIAALWICTGLLVYRLYSRHHAIVGEGDVLVLEEEPAAEDGGEYRIMVAVANLDNALSFVRTTYSISGAMKARVELLHMVPVPSHVPLSQAYRYMQDGREAIGETMLYLAPLFPISSTIRYCRNVARGIVSAVRQKRTDLLIMGWHGRKTSRGFDLGSTVDPVTELAPCDLLILKNCGDHKYKNILLPLVGGPNSELALKTAAILANRNDGTITAFTVAGDGEDLSFDINAFIASRVDALDLPLARIVTKVAHDHRTAHAILQEAESDSSNYDLVIIGSSREPLLRRVRRQSVPDVVAELCAKPLIMASASSGLHSWINRWL
ncbi:MAG: amino acid permease [Lentisphaerales bacterium]|jgi:APA family basic amino acid/polyamine antiporter|nr:MAG: amino acid permease [Lentisphaerales bacterium]